MARVDINILVQQLQALDPKHQEIIAELATALAQKTGAQIEQPDLRPCLGPWLQHLSNEGKSPHTIRQYRLYTTKLLNSFPSPTPIDIEAYITVAAPRVKTNTIFIQTRAFRSFFSYVNERGLSNVKPEYIPRVKFTPRRRLAPPPENVAKLLSYKKLKPRSRVLLYILVDSGPRISEVLQLRRPDIDLNHRRIQLLGKGNKQRTVPVSERTAKAIADLLATSSSNYLFPGRSKHVTWTSHAVGSHIKVLCHKVGIPAITPHQLRHFFATQTINSGANIRSISEILGHKNPSITLDVYCHTNEELNTRQHAEFSPLSKILGKESE